MRVVVIDLCYKMFFFRNILKNIFFNFLKIFSIFLILSYLNFMI